VVAAAGSGWSFLLNAASFFGVIFFLCKWRRVPHEPLATRRVRDAILEGFATCGGAPQVRSVLIRTGAFSVGGDFAAGFASGNLPAAWSAGVRTPADLFWVGGVGGSDVVTAVAGALLGRWTGRGGDFDLLRA